MNYRHQYHAGNFADVLKHTVLIALLQSLVKKDKPLCYLDTHAGRGLYDLQSLEAQKTLEFKNGVEKMFQSSSLPEAHILKKYGDILRNHGYPQYYPGSPLIAAGCLRPQDSLILIEKHPEEARVLKQVCLAQSLKVHVHQQEGYQAIKALLPPEERRGLILIDPPFEQENEWKKILEALKVGLQRFANGLFVVWYPIKSATEVQQFHKGLQAFISDLKVPALMAELCIYPEDTHLTLKGAGLIIINPPWQIESSLNELLAQLFRVLSVNNAGHYQLKPVLQA